MNLDPVTGRGELIAASEQPAREPAGAGHDAPVGFFVIGVIVNVALIAAYFVWAWRQSRRRDERDD